MTTTVPITALTGLPEPERSRWQPLRAGILNLFRYDEQIFTFHRGRLLIRGNNGSGKSMALEVLLPYVLDADLTPSRLSTFGGRDRNMYLWLLGFDKTGSRTSERAYVWVEFGRQLLDGAAEYFTAGAMLEGTRGAEVKPTYFTCASRLGVHVTVGGPGQEPLNRHALAEQLAEQAAAGRPGAVHADGKTHRRAVNDALFRLPDKRFDQLRATLRQLRRPKLSDKLDENGLDTVLRDSLPTVAQATLADLAEGFERLDRHGAAVTELEACIGHLGTLRDTFRRYARAAVAARADAVAAAETGIEQVRVRTAAAQAEEAAATFALVDVGRRRDEITRRTAIITGRTDALKDTDGFRQGQDLGPLRLLVDELKRIAGEAREAGHRAEQRATVASTAAERRAAQATGAASALSRTRAVAAAAAVAARTSDLDRDLAFALAEIDRHDVTDEAALDTDVAAAHAQLERLAERMRPWDAQVDTLLRLQGQADGKRAAVAVARTEVERARSEVVGVEETLNGALEADRMATLRWLDQLTVWAGASVQLAAGQAPPLPWEADTAAVRAHRWAEEAATARTRTLVELQGALTAAAGKGLAAADRAEDLAEALERLGELTGRARATAADRVAAVAAYRAGLHGWWATLEELPRANPVPDWTAVEQDGLAAAARRWAGTAATIRSGALHGEQTSIDDALRPLRMRVQELTAREARLAAFGPPELELPVTRGADRSGRPGAPMYLLVEFADGVDQETRLGVEAATIGAGLADAWVSPDGLLCKAADGSVLLDTQLVGADLPEPGDSVADVLQPAVDPVVPGEVVAALLRRIRCAPTAAATGGGGELTIGRDGSWRAGALTGAHRVPEITLLGAAAREADRRAKLAAVRAELADVTAGVAALDLRAGAVTTALGRVEAERGSVPDDDDLRAAATAATTAAGAAADRATTVARGLAVATAAVILPESLEPEDDDASGDRAAAALRERVAAALDAVSVDPAAGHEIALPERARSARVLATARRIAGSKRTAAAVDIRTDLDSVAAERAARPAEDAVRAARGELQTARSSLAEAARRLTDRRQDEQRARDSAEMTEQALRAAVLGAGLPTDADLPALAAAVTGYRTSTQAWLRAAAEAVRAAGTAALALRDALNSAEEAAAARSGAETATSRHLENAERLRTLTEDYGDEYAAIVDQLDELRVEEEGLAAELPGLSERERTHLVAQARARAELESAAEARTSAENARAAAQESFLAADRVGLVAAAGLPAAAAAPDGRPPAAPADRPPAAPADRPAEAPADRPAEDGEPDPVEGALGLRAVRTWARAVRDAVGDRLLRDPLAVESAANRVTERRHELEPQLANGGVSVRDELRDGLLVLHAGRGGRSLPLVEMTGALGEELVAAHALLDAAEADLFRKFLADSTRREVTSRVRDARTQVTEMARLMAAHPTGSGLRVQLRWVPDERNAPGMQEIVKLMGKDAPLASERERLQEFFRARVAQVRAHAEIDYTTHLSELLDYRQWWRFVVEYKRGADTGWTPLTGKAHGSLSGGEKAVCLHLPLFAAAASYCDNAPLRVEEPDGSTSPGAPRLILLDEVFAGVDEDNRGELFELIRDLDLDLVATSESERGLYPQIDGLGIYQLYAGDNAVLAAHSVWDGATEHNLLEDDLLRDIGDADDLFT